MEVSWRDLVANFLFPFPSFPAPFSFKIAAFSSASASSGASAFSSCAPAKFTTCCGGIFFCGAETPPSSPSPSPSPPPAGACITMVSPTWNPPNSSSKSSCIMHCGISITLNSECSEFCAISP